MNGGSNEWSLGKEGSSRKRQRIFLIYKRFIHETNIFILSGIMTLLTTIQVKNTQFKWRTARFKCRSKSTATVKKSCKESTTWKMSKYAVFSGLYFPVFSSNTPKRCEKNCAFDRNLVDQKELRIWTLFTHCCFQQMSKYYWRYCQPRGTLKICKNAKPVNCSY